MNLPNPAAIDVDLKRGKFHHHCVFCQHAAATPSHPKKDIK
jgi:hypothetical protein